ncbi:MAG: UDP-2,3-diacylglucosamine diphosphatase LpxI [Alphaproteobacteria bacterium]|nr:UDP-2,3-diacylglucosamine diphosphatase LpxI [Alphaproteobacteria bacterium]
MSKKLGIIAGGGDIPKALITRCKEQKRDFFVVAIEGNADRDLIDDNVPHIWIRIGQAGTGFKKLAEEKVDEVVMIGTIRRPSFKDLVPDLRTTAFFAKLGIKSIGDDGILRALVKELESDGLIVRGIQEVMPEILIREGVLGKIKPSKQAKADIERAVEVATELGRLDVGQAVIVQQGLVLGVEGIEGTGELIRRCGTYQRKGEGGVLVKIRKPQQDMRIDLPTIGDRTVKSAYEAGLSGIVLHAGNGLIANEKETIELADKYGLFVMGINPADYYEGAK